MPLPDPKNPNSSVINTSLPNGTTDFTVGNLINQNQVAEGPTIPPIQQGQYRVPKPSGFAVQSISSAKPIGTIVVFTWDDIQSFGADIAEYRIYATLAVNANPEPTVVGAAQQSPCYVTIVSPQATSAIFTLRPYLANGQTLPLAQCPTCTVAIPAPVFQLQEGGDIIYIDSQRPTGGGSGSTTVTTFDFDNTWTAPANVTSVTVECWGPGGAGGNATYTGGPIGVGGGGGGGAYATKIVTVIPLTTYNIGAPVGGTALPSYFNTSSTVSAAGGASGDSTGFGTGGQGGQAAASVGTSTTSGTNGSNGTVPGVGGAGGGAAVGGGAGGAGGSAATGGDGTAPGGGGGGGGYGGGIFYNGGHGGTGRVKLTYTTTAGSGTAPGIGVVNANGQLSSLTDIGLLFINSSGKISTALGTDGSGNGFVQISDGTTADDLVLLPGHTATATGGAATLPGNPVGFIKVTIGGTAMRIPYYAA